MTEASQKTGVARLVESSTAWMGGGAFAAFTYGCTHFGVVPPAWVIGVVVVGVTAAYAFKEGMRRSV